MRWVPLTRSYTVVSYRTGLHHFVPLRGPMKNLRISKQLILLVTGLMVAFGIMTYLQIRSAADSIYKERYGMLRTQVESGLAVLQFYYDQEKAGKLTEDQARTMAYDAAAHMLYNPDGYLFGYDYD